MSGIEHRHKILLLEDDYQFANTLTTASLIAGTRDSLTLITDPREIRRYLNDISLITKMGITTVLSDIT